MPTAAAQADTNGVHASRGRAWPRTTHGALLALSLLVAAAPTAGAQRYGQWWWDASAGLTRRQYRNLLDGASLGTRDERDLDLGLRVNGFLLHPALLRFRLGLEASLSSYKARTRLDTRRFGLAGNVNVTPYGAYPLSLYGGRQLYDYSKLTEDDPLNLLGVPDAAWSVGGRLRLRRGVLRGTRLAYDRTSLGFVGDGAFGRSLREDALVEWDRSGRRFERRAHLDRRRQDYGVVDFRQRDWTATYDQRGPLDPRWRWEMFATGLHRDLTYGTSHSPIDSLRTSQRLIQTGERRDVLDLSYEGGFTRGGGASFQSHLLAGRYRLRRGPEWVVAPFAGYGFQQSGGLRAHVPSAGASATWTRRRGAFDLSLTGGAGYLLLLPTSGGSDSALGLDFGASLGHGDETRLRTELDLAWTSNRLRRAGESVADLPDLGASLGGTGTEDLFSGRLALRRRWRQFSLYSLSEGTRRDLRARLGTPAARLENLSETLQLGAPRVTLTGNLSGARVGGGTPQSLHSWYAALSWRPLRLVSLTGSYRADRRTLTLAPSLRGRRYEAQADVRVGAFVLRGQVFDTTEQSAELERVNRGFVFSLSRQFAGWLPIVTGPPEGGVIR